MRLIPLILVLLFAAGCKTVRVYEHHGKEKTVSTTARELPREDFRDVDEKKPVEKTVDELAIDIDKDFEFVPAGWPMGLSVGQTEASVLNNRPYKPLKREPAYRSHRPLYGYLTLGNSSASRFSFAIDYLEATSWVIWVDLNNNGDLTDDGPGFKPQEGAGTFVSINVPVITASGSKIHRPYRISLWIEDQKGILVSKFYAVSHYRKKLNIGNKKYTAVVFEKSRHDALYKDSGVWIDLDRNGKLDKRKEHFKNDQKVAIAGQKLRLKLIHP